MNLKAKILLFLLFAYGAYSIVPSRISDNGAMLYQQESSGLPFHDPLSTGQEASDIEDNFSQDDESFIDLSSISFFMSESNRFHYLNDSQLPGSLNLPFSPPEIAV